MSGPAERSADPVRYGIIESPGATSGSGEERLIHVLSATSSYADPAT